MRTLSFRSLKLCPQFAGMNEIEMLSLDNDKAMAEVLGQLGFDTEYAVVYVPSVHRCMANKVALGFVAIGEINLNSSFVDSPLCTLTERMIAAAYTDPSLTRELSSLMGMRSNLRMLLDSGCEGEGEDLPDWMLEPDRDFVSKQIQDLTVLRDVIRGPLLNDRGEAKSYFQYAEYKLSQAKKIG